MTLLLTQSEIQSDAEISQSSVSFYQEVYLKALSSCPDFLALVLPTGTVRMDKEPFVFGDWDAPLSGRSVMDLLDLATIKLIIGGLVKGVSHFTISLPSSQNVCHRVTLNIRVAKLVSDSGVFVGYAVHLVDEYLSVLEKHVAYLVQDKDRMARDLHDSLGQEIYSIYLMLKSFGFELEQDALKKQVHLLESLLRGSIDTLRGILSNTEPGALMHNSFKDAIHLLKYYVPSSCGISYEPVIVSDQTHLLSRSQLVHLYRIVQEFLMNSLKYSKGTLFLIVLSGEGDKVCIEMSDNGIGFDLPTCTLNRGVLNIRKRLALLHCAYIYTSFPGKGTKLKIEINGKSSISSVC